MTRLRHQDLTGEIIGVYYDVYNGTGRTYPEFIYERAMMADLKRQGIACRQQAEYHVYYKDKLVGIQKPDLFIADKVIVEIKVASRLSRLHKAQAISYLKLTGKEVGLLCNFGGGNPEFRRLYFKAQASQNAPEIGSTQVANLAAGLILPELTHTIIGGLYEVHAILGPGFIHRIYAKAVYHELLLRGLEVLFQTEYQIIYRGHSVGNIKFNHLQVFNSVLVFPVAVQDIDNISINNLKAWMKRQKISLGILANFWPASLEFMMLRV